MCQESAFVGDNTTRKGFRRDFIDSTMCLERMFDSIELPAEYSEFELEKLHTQVDHNRKRHILKKSPKKKQRCPYRRSGIEFNVHSKSPWVVDLKKNKKSRARWMIGSATREL